LDQGTSTLGRYRLTATPVAAGRPPDRTADHVRARDQSQDRQGAWAHGATITGHPSRRGDRVTLLCANYAAYAHSGNWHRPTVRRCRGDRVRNLGVTRPPMASAQLWRSTSSSQDLSPLKVLRNFHVPENWCTELHNISNVPSKRCRLHPLSPRHVGHLAECELPDFHLQAACVS